MVALRIQIEKPRGTIKKAGEEVRDKKDWS